MLTHSSDVLFTRNKIKNLKTVSNIISSHNKSILNIDPEPSATAECNCRNRTSCPLSGKCCDKQVIYLCNVKTSPNDEGINYIGLTENTFKERWNQHKHTFKHESKANSTELSKYVWNTKKAGITPTLSWKIIDHARPYVNGGKSCDLCVTEKFHIITSKLKILNKRTELVSTCRHANKYLLKNYKTLRSGIT